MNHEERLHLNNLLERIDALMSAIDDLTAAVSANTQVTAQLVAQGSGSNDAAIAAAATQLDTNNAALLKLVTSSTTPPVEGIPTVIGVSPGSGPAAGGESVTIVGTNFTGATGVNFGSIAAASFTVSDDSHIVAVTEASPVTGNVDVTVANGSGTSLVSPADVYDVTP